MKQGREYWRRHVEAWGRGGQSKKAYCDQHGVSYWSMRYWTNKLSASAASPDQGLVELGPVGRLGADGEQRAAIELVVGERYVVRLWPTMDGAHLREVLTVLESLR